MRANKLLRWKKVGFWKQISHKSILITYKLCVKEYQFRVLKNKPIFCKVGKNCQLAIFF